MLTGVREVVPHGDRYVGAKIYPTGEGVIYPLHRKKNKGDHPLSGVKEEYSDNQEFWQENTALFGVRAACSKLLAVAAANSHLQAGGVQGEREPLESTSAAISHTPRNRKGAGGLTAKAKRVLRYSAGTVERRAGSPTNVSFLTLTVPPMDFDAWERVVRGWGDVLRTFVQWLSRRLKAKGLPALIVGCTELQTVRASRTSEPALHIHAVFQGRKKKQAWAVSPEQCRSAWKRAIESQSGVSLDFSSCENLVRVRRSALSYLSKYLSKGGNQWKALVAPRFADLHPSSWSFTPDSLKRAFELATWKGDQALAVLQLALYNPQYRHGEVVELPIYRLPNGNWVKVVLIKLDRAFARSLDSSWVG